VFTPSRVEDANSSDDESGQNFATATIAPKRTREKKCLRWIMIVNLSILIAIILKRCLVIIHKNITASLITCYFRNKR
jgi:hypothetical protein